MNIVGVLIIIAIIAFVYAVVMIGMFLTRIK